MPHHLSDGRLLLGGDLRLPLSRRRHRHGPDQPVDIEALALASPIGRRVATIRDLVVAGHRSAPRIVLAAREEALADHAPDTASALALATLVGMHASDHLDWDEDRLDDVRIGPRWGVQPGVRDLDIMQPAVSVDIAAMTLLADPLTCWSDAAPSVATGALPIRVLEAGVDRQRLHLDHVAAALADECRVLDPADRPGRDWIDRQLRRLVVVLVDTGWVEVVRDRRRGLPTIAVTTLGLVGMAMLYVKVRAELPGPLPDATDRPYDSRSASAMAAARPYRFAPTVLALGP